KAALARESGFTGDLVFTAHLLPVRRGILETIHVPLARAIDRVAAEEIYETVYADEPCVAVLHGALPSLKDVVYRNRVAIGGTAVGGPSARCRGGSGCRSRSGTAGGSRPRKWRKWSSW